MPFIDEFAKWVDEYNEEGKDGREHNCIYCECCMLGDTFKSWFLGMA